MNKETLRREQEPTQKFEALERLFGENFNPEKTIELKVDLDEHNQERELGDCQTFWTEFKNPETGEVVEGKVYVPEGTEECKEVFIISPGYKGDFVLQEANYADDFAKGNRALVVLRHNSMRIKGDDVKNYIHCPEKADTSQNTGQEYIGKGEDFDFEKAGREVLTALKSLGDRVDNIEKIDILGHSWGGRISLDSLNQLNEESDETAEKIKNKIKNLILLGAWIETRENILRGVQKFLEAEVQGNYFKGLDAEKFMNDLLETGKKIEKLTPDNLPKNMRIVAIESVEDGDIDLQGEILPFFNRMKGLKRKGNITLKDLKELLPEQIGGRETETHDYALEQVRRWIGKIIRGKE